MFNLASKILNLLGFYGVLWLLFDSLMNKYITIGEFAAIFSYIQKMYSALENMVVNRIGNLLSYDYNGIKYFINFLDEKEEEQGEKEYAFHQNIELKMYPLPIPEEQKNQLKI